MSYSILMRVIFPLLLGYWIARRTRHLIMGLVLRLMPLKMRLSQKAFALQTRITIIVGIVIIAITVLVLNYAYARLAPLIEQPTKKVQQELIPVPEPVQPPVPPVPPVVPPEPEVEKPAPQPELQRTVVPAPQPPVYAYQQPKAPIETPVYLQLSAFRNYESAWDLHQRLSYRFSRPVWVGQHAYDYAPYKVLIGPFRSRRAALDFKKAHRLKAFPRTLNEIHLYQS